MNPAQYGEWELDQIDWLVAHGTPRKAAQRIAKIAKEDAMREARAAEDDRQFVIDYKEHGSAEMARRREKSREWARTNFLRILQENSQENLAPELRRA